MMFLRTLDRYVLREWVRIFAFTTLGFPLIAILFELIDNLNSYLGREQVTGGDIVLGYIVGLPEQIFQVIPAAVLFSTVFSIGSLSRHSELTAIKASGRSFHRAIMPIMVFALLAAGLGLIVGEAAPVGTRLKAELLGEIEQRSQTTRFNFVYRADEGWVYTIRNLDISRHYMTGVVLTREGVGEDYPTLVLQGEAGSFDSVAGRWTLEKGWYRVVSGLERETAFQFDSLRHRMLVEAPEQLLAEPKAPEEMRYAELQEYIEALERSGGDAAKLQVQQALKIAIPFTSVIIAIFGAPMALTAPRAGGAFGVAVSLGTTVIFLILVQLSQAVGAGRVLPPVLAAWTPNMLFGTAGVVLLARTRS